ncbi:MAG: hypothetical protein AVO33_06520 [delta proteobacterium ML8_F1]|nr:MAG: hypothetical protein AVO33_06520 [delta proteobacterium ML8_F1]
MKNHCETHIKPINQELPLKTHCGVLVLPIDAKGNVVLVSHRVPREDNWRLSMPYDDLKLGEMPEEGALRVLMEEAGYFGGQIEPLGIYRPLGGIVDMIYLFVATELVAIKRNHEMACDVHVFSLSPHGVGELIHEGTFTQEPGIKAFTRFYLIDGRK